MKIRVCPICGHWLCVPHWWRIFKLHFQSWVWQKMFVPTWHRREDPLPIWLRNSKQKLWASDGIHVWEIWSPEDGKFSPHVTRVLFWAEHNWPEPPLSQLSGKQ